MRFFEPLELAVEKVEPFTSATIAGLTRPVCRFQINREKGATHTMVGDEFVRPGEPFEMVPVELARLRRADRCEDTGGIPAENRAVGHIGEAGNRK